MRNSGLLGATLVLAFMSSACGAFRLVPSRYKETKSIAIVQVIGEPDKDVKTPLDMKNMFSGHPVWERVVTNDAIAIQDFLKSRGFAVITIEQMIQSDNYRHEGTYIGEGHFAPAGMKVFTGRDTPGREISFMTANELAKSLGVDAVVTVTEKWKAESQAITKKLARTIVKIQMVDLHSNQIWMDQDFADSSKPISEAMGFKQASPEDFVADYNEAFATTLKQMQARVDAELAK